jgi:hypothetical protein
LHDVKNLLLAEAGFVADTDDKVSFCKGHKFNGSEVVKFIVGATIQVKANRFCEQVKFLPLQAATMMIVCCKYKSAPRSLLTQNRLLL